MSVSKVKQAEPQQPIPNWLFQAALDRKDFYIKNERGFRRLFGTSLWHYLDLLTGFDIVRFDDWLKTPDGTSTADFLKQKYGNEAYNLVKRLISI